MKNWKTTLSGLVSAFACFVEFSPSTFVKWPWVVALAKWIMIGGLAGVGFTAKDSTTHSTVTEVEAAKQ